MPDSILPRSCTGPTTATRAWSSSTPPVADRARFHRNCWPGHRIAGPSSRWRGLPPARNRSTVHLVVQTTTDAAGSPRRTGAFELLQRVTATVRNVAEVVRYGGLETNETSSPYVVAADQRSYRLRHYFADTAPVGAPPILLVPPLMLTTEVWDISPRASAVAALHEEGLDIWVVDFGHPDRDPGGLARDVADHVMAISDAVDRVRDATGQDVLLGGYSQGGMFAYQTAAFRRCKGVDSLVTFGAPVDSTAPLPIP